MPSSLIPIILCGGAGTRLWPVSRLSRPKPFIRLSDGQTLLEKTFRRATALNNVSQLISISNRDYFFPIKDEYERSHAIQSIDYLLEPYARNTAPAIALAALHAQEHYGDDALLLVLPADHLIDHQAQFAAAVAQAVKLATQDYLVTFGITPQHPETGFGYIQSGEPLTHGYSVARFVEKPDIATAQSYLDAGCYYWNAGMFCFRTACVLKVMADLCPDVYQAALNCYHSSQAQHFADTYEISETLFRTAPDISFDYAVMEKAAKASQVAVVPCDIGWQDIGSWNALANLIPADKNGNRIDGNATTIKTHNTYINSTRLVATVGVEDLIIVDTDDAILIANRHHAQEVKHVVDQLKNEGNTLYQKHHTNIEPPHYYTQKHTLKIGETHSLLANHNQTGYWVIVDGSGILQLDELQQRFGQGDTIHIPFNSTAHLNNNGESELTILEILTHQTTPHHHDH